ncbi:MAG: DUF1963 domain-containing protein [Bacteroidales bacterium]|jgi:predicted DNA-binding WGR domain protein/uncharacterized protein YwqG|nr:DUF1963 domain-containing protein [Bacteroidales bacterium]
MKRTLVFQDGDSQKFWSIEVNGTGFTVNYGRLGTKGQFQTKSFETEEKCQKEASKLIAEKTRKGYNELADGAEMPELVIVEKDPNAFQFSKEQKAMLKERVEDEQYSKKEAKLLEKLVLKHIIPCFNLKIVDGKPTPLDSSVGGIPYCPIGEELPKDENGNEIPLLIQLNLEGIELPGYPNKGIFQLFMKENPPDLEWEDFEEIMQTGNRARYYEDITAEYRKDIPYSNHSMAGACGNDMPADQRHYKIQLEKGWSMYPLLYAEFFSKEAYIFGNCEIFNEILKILECEQTLADIDPEEYFDYDSDFFDVFSDMFPDVSNIGGYGSTPQGQTSIPYSVAKDKKDAKLIHLSEDIISWGDCGCIYFFYEDITKIKKDQSLWGYGDMS